MNVMNTTNKQIQFLKLIIVTILIAVLSIPVNKVKCLKAKSYSNIGNSSSNTSCANYFPDRMCKFGPFDVRYKSISV